MLDRFTYQLRQIVALCKSAVLCGPRATFHLWRITRQVRKRGYGIWLADVRHEKE